MGVVLREQLEANPANAPILDQAFEAIETLEAGNRVDAESLHPALQPLFGEAVQSFVMDLMAFDPVAVTAARPEGQALLVVGGGRDIQVTRADYDAMAGMATEAAFFETMTHTLKSVESESRMAIMGSYMNPDMPLVDGLADEVAAFVVEVGK
jgi:hypothetical protein